MSDKLHGKIKSFPSGQVPILGKRPRIEKVDINIPSIQSQRRTHAKTIDEWFEAEGGYSHELFDFVKVGEWKDPDTGEIIQKRWEGDHTRLMRIHAFPDEQEIDALIYEVENEKAAELLFTKQKTRTKDLSAEENFVAEFRGGDPNATKHDKFLRQAKIEVQSYRGNSVPTNNPDLVTINVTLLESLQRRFKYDIALKAVEIFKDVYKKQRRIQAEFVRGVACAFTECPDLYNKPKSRARFETWLRKLPSLFGKPSRLTGHAKGVGGKIANKDMECVALGLIRLFKESVDSNQSDKQKLSTEGLINKIKNN